MLHEDTQFSSVKAVSQAIKEGRDPFPLIFEIHPTDICNHRCSFCFHGGVGYDSTRKTEVLSLEQYISLFAELNKLGISEISISGGGEPFLDKRLCGLIDKAAEANLDIRIITHGNFLSDEMIPSLLKCREVRMSIEAITPQTYERIRGVSGSLMEASFLNIRKLLTARRNSNLGASNVQIGVTFLICNENYTEALPFSKLMLQDIGVDELIFKHDIYSDRTTSSTVFDTVLEQLAQIKDPRLKIRDLFLETIKGSRCFVPYFKIAANPYGEVFSCCLGSQPGEQNGYKLGSLQLKSFSEIWLESSELRKKLMNKGVGCESCNHNDYVLSKEVLKELESITK